MQMKMFDTGIFKYTAPLELYCMKKRIKYTCRYPKDLENFQICECNTRAYQRFKPMQELKDKYEIQDWEVDESNPNYNELSFTMNMNCSFLITGGGKVYEGDLL